MTKPTTNGLDPMKLPTEKDLSRALGIPTEWAEVPEMVERVARAIENQMAEDANLPEDIARAVVEAMREPTAAMIVAGTQTHEGATYSGIPSWQAMIDAALNE